MTFSLHGEQHGFPRNPVAALCAMLAWLCLAIMPPSAMGQLKVGQPLDFGSFPVGNPVTLQVVFSATGTTTVTSASVLTDGAVGQDFTVGFDTCIGTVQQGTTCAISITFTAKQVGVRHGVLLLYNGTSIINQVFLHGVGTGGAFAFAPANVSSTNVAKGLSPATFTSGSAVQDGYGNIYFTDVQNQRILEQTTTGTISQVASLPVSSTSSIVIGADGTLFVSAQNSVYAFQPGSSPTPLNTGSVVLVTPSGLAVDSLGNLYMADAATGIITKYSLATGQTSAVTLAALTPGLSSPKGLALDASNNLYVADSGNDRVVEISASTGASLVLLFSGVSLNNPTGLTVDPAGTVYVTDTGNSRLVELTVNGVNFALTDPNLTLATPTGVLMKPNGDLVISDTTLGQVLIPRSIPSVTFPTPTVIHTLDSTDGAEVLVLQATGNSVAQLVFPTSGTEPTISSGAFANTAAGTCPTINQGSSYTPLQFAIGDICSYNLTFTPTAVGTNTGNFEVDINIPGGTATYTTIVPLSGTGLSSITAFSLVASPSSTTVGVPVGLTLTALNASSGVAVDYNGTVTFTSTDSTGVFLSGNTYTFTAANQGVLVLPASAGIQFNQIGTFTVHVTDGQYQTTSNAVLVRNVSTISTFKSSINPSVPNQTTTLSATVTSAGPTPTGTVTFYSGNTALGTANIINGTATLPTSFATPGTYPLIAVYNGDGSNAGTTSATLYQNVLNPTTVSSFTSSINPSLVGEATQLTVTLASTGPVPTGTVQFLSGTTVLGTSTVNNGVATLSASFPAVGTYALSAIYSGDSHDATVTATLSQLVVNPVSIAITSSANPSLLGQQVTLSTTVSSTSGIPGGTVKFYDGATLLGSATLASGKASVLSTFTSIGIHTITVVYSGDAADVGATSGGYAQDVVTPTISGALKSSVNPSLVNQSTTLTETVTSTLSSPTPTGTVSFYSGTTLLGTSTLANGTATLAVSFAAVGSYSLTAVYSGDTYNGTVTSGPLTQVVLAPGSVVLTSSINPSLVGQATTLSAFLGTTTATGTISFYDGATLLGTSTVSSGVATLSASFSTLGVHTLTAVYSGDSNNATATSAPVQQDVVIATNISAFTSSVNPSLVGQSTTLTLTLASSNGTPTGTVRFFSGGVLLGTSTLSNGTATLPATFGAVGSYALTAIYSGDTTHATVTAGPLTQVVVATGSVVLTSSINPSLVGQTTTLSAFLGSKTATGTVTFLDGTTVLGTASVSAGLATLGVSFSTPGLHSLTAAYGGDSANAAATSPAYSQDVVTPAIATSFTSSVNPSTVGQSTTLSLALTNNGSAAAPTGTVTFYSNGASLGTATISGGIASLPVSFAAVGSYALTAVYAGDANNASASAGPLTQVVTSSSSGGGGTGGGGSGSDSVVLTSSLNPSLISQITTLTAFLGPTTATGTVSFYDGATLLGTSTIAGGSATLQVSFSTAGIHSLTAVYSGDANNAKATSSPLLQDVVTPSTVSSFTSSVNPSTVGQSTTLAVTLASSNGVPTGSVTFYSNGVSLGTAILSNGQASLPVTFAAAGTYALTAIYSGDTTHATITAGPLTQVVFSSTGGGGGSGGGGGTSTLSVLLTSSVNPTLIGQATVLTSFLSGTGATGTVNFYDGTTLLGTGTVSGDTASLAVSFNTAGLHNLTAVYSGDTNYAAATSPIYSQDVLTPTLAASFTSSVNPSTVGQSTTLSVSLNSSNGTPTGTVAFYNGTTLLGTGLLNNGTASLSISFAVVGSYPLTAVYSGDTTHATVTAGPLTQVVVTSGGGGGGGTGGGGGGGSTSDSVVLTSSVNPTLVNQSTTLTAFLGPTSATGTVSFYDGGTLLGTGTIVNGSVSLIASFTTAGIHSLTAAYSGDSNNAATTSAAVLQDVVTATTSTSFTSSINPSQVNQSTTLTVTLQGASSTPTGTVQFLSGTTLLGTATLTNGVATLPVSFAAAGSYALTAIYSGDTTNATLTVGPLTQVVVSSSGGGGTGGGTGGGGSSSFVVLTSSVNPSLVGQSTTLSAFLGSASATGTITFLDGTTTLGVGAISNGLATLSVSFATVGLHSLTAVYSGDSNYAKAISTAYAQQVVSPTIAGSLSSSVNPSLVGQSTTLSVSLSNSSATLTGTVKFFDGATLIGTSTVANAAASVAVSFATPGTHSLTAVYSGDANNAPVTTAPLSQIVISSSTITLTSSVNPSLIGQSTLLTATLGSTSATGTITFFDGSTQIGSGTVSGGASSVSVSFSTSGIHSLTAVYSGDANNAKATSAIYAQDVQTTDSAALTTSVNPASLGQPVTLTATIKFNGTATPTGTVSFFSGGTLLGSGSVSGGIATLATTFTTLGTRSLTCQYAGDTNYAPAACPAISLPVVNASAVTLSSSLNPSNFNQSVTFTATVSSGGSTPTGTVSFYNGTQLLTTVTLAAGSDVATYTTNALPVGTDTIKASYSGDTNTAAASATLAQSVLNPATIQFNCPTIAALVNTATTLTATVSSTGTAPTGTVKFYSGTTLLGTGTLVNGVATVSVNFPAAGTQTLTAVYSGDSNNAAITSAPCTLAVVQAATITLASSVNPSTVQQSVTFTATINSSGPTPTGSVKFFSGATLLGTASLSSGIATLNNTFTTAGSYTITAVYSGDANTSPATSAALTQVVRNIATLTLTSSISSILLDNQDTLSVLATSTGVTPTGLITFYAGTAPLGNATLVNGVATLVTSFPVTGTLTLTAVYYGDANTAPATSGGVQELVGDISVAVAPGLPTSASVLAGGTAQYTLVLTPLVVDPLPSAVSFSVSGLPKGAVATFSPATVAAGQSTTQFVLSVSVPAITGELRGQPPLPGGFTPRRAAPIAAALLLLPLAFVRRRRLSAARGRLTTLLLLVLMAAGASALTGCLSAANSGYYGQTQQTYNLTVTATSGQLSRTTAVTLIVQ